MLRVLGADGLVLLGPESERGKPWPAERPPNGWREAGLSGQPPAILGYASAEGAPDRPSLGWVVVAQRDRAAVLAPLWSFGLWLGLGTLGVAALGGVLAGLYAGRMGSTIQRVLGGSGRGDVAHQLEQLRDQAWRDPLTGLLNRAGFAAWQQALPPIAHGCAVVALDLDGFKPINDTHGHAAGDDVLRGIGAWFLQNLRVEDAAVRLGGDEFLLCLVGPPDKVEAAAREVGLRLNFMLREGVPTETGRLRLGCSLGVALLPRDAATMEQAIARADAALYEAKRHKVPVLSEVPPAQAAE
jgi:diguanylate cyclase (GGDEF)-like protein